MKPILTAVLTTFVGIAAFAFAACTSLEHEALAPHTLAQPLLGDLKVLTIDELFDKDKKIDFSGKPPSGPTWLDDEHYAESKSEGKRSELHRIEAATGKAETFGDTSELEAAIARVPEIKPGDAGNLAQWRLANMSTDRSRMLVTLGKDLFVWTFAAKKLVRLTNTPDDAEEEASFSPDAKRVAFVRGHDLYVSDIDPPAERRLTKDGSESILNAKLDWVYQEEVYGRGNFHAYWWSPDSSEIAFLQLDEKDVPGYTLVDDVPLRPIVSTTPYPRSGEPNPTVKLGLTTAARPDVHWVDLGRYAADEPIVCDVTWLDPKTLSFQVQNREQTWLDLDVASSSVLAPKLLFREASKAWVNAPGSPKPLADGTFLIASERTGWKHLYHYKNDGTLLNAVTSGAWEARTLHGVDEATKWVYFSGTERSPIGSDVYRIRLDGSDLTRLSAQSGTHNASFSPNFARYIDTWSDLWTPPQVRVHKSDGSQERTLHEGKVPALSEYAFSAPELTEVKTKDRFTMEAMLIKPVGFDPKQRYPVYEFTYSGPHSQQVLNRWLGTSGMFYQLLAERGIIVWVCDNRTASGKGAESEYPCYQRFGESELADLETGIAWLASQPWVDPTRIALSGWSYGGFMTSYALTHSKTYSCGIAGGSVTDWRNYDSIYTERYMRQPKNNDKGYNDTSVIKAAANLHGDLLLVHGAMDDNVHPQNTVQLAYELQKAGKPFRMMLFPRQPHGIRDPPLTKSWQAMLLAFIEEHLLAPHGSS